MMLIVLSLINILVVKREFLRYIDEVQQHKPSPQVF